MSNRGWFVVYCFRSANVVNSSNIFLVDPQAYISGLYFLSGTRCRYHRSFYSDFYSDFHSDFRKREVTSAKAKVRQATYFQATIDAKVRCQYRYASAYRRRIF